MSLRKRLRVVLAALTQQVQPFTCPCGAQSFVIGDRFEMPTQRKDQKCEACEERELDIWVEEYERQAKEVYA